MTHEFNFFISSSALVYIPGYMFVIMYALIGLNCFFISDVMDFVCIFFRCIHPTKSGIWLSLYLNIILLHMHLPSRNYKLYLRYHYGMCYDKKYSKRCKNTWHLWNIGLYSYTINSYWNYHSVITAFRSIYLKY